MVRVDLGEHLHGHNDYFKELVSNASQPGQNVSSTNGNVRATNCSIDLIDKTVSFGGWASELKEFFTGTPIFSPSSLLMATAATTLEQANAMRNLAKCMVQ